MFAFPGQSLVGRMGKRVPTGTPLSDTPARTYAEFQTHIQGLATGGIRIWEGSLPSGSAGGKWYTTRTAGTVGTMYGSPWQPATPYGFLQQNCSTARLMQHGLTLGAYNQQVSNNGSMYFEVKPLPGSNPLVAVTRNGYTSLADGASFTTSQLVDLIRWDFTLNKAFRSNPSAGTAETEYTW